MMMNSRMRLLAAAGLSMLALTACSDNQPVVQETPPASTEAPATAPEESGRSETQEALDRIREAAEATGRAVREEAGRLGERGREALQDAQPTLDRAGEYASRIGQSLNEIARRALSDFDAGVAELERRLDAYQGETEAFTGERNAVLASPDLLATDTRAAARAQASGIGPDYVGVWAQDAASCARIDREAMELFAVITPTTLRRHETMCNFEASEMNGTTARLAASCIAEGDVEERIVAIDMPTADTLMIGTPDMPGSTELVRCRLPE